MPGTCASTRSSALFGTSSKLSTASPSAASRWRSSASAAVGRVEPDPGDGARADRRDQPQARRGDDAERAFGADQQLLEVVAAIVLLERASAPRTALPSGSTASMPEHQRAHRAEAQHLGAAGIGRDQAADRRRALGAERQREAPPGRAAPPRAGRRGSRRPRRPRLAGSASSERIRFIRRSESSSASPAGVRRRAADHRGVAALRHQRHAGLRRRARTISADLLACRRREHRRGRAAIAAAPVGQPRRELVGVAGEALRPEQVGELVEQVAGEDRPSRPG